jgi:YfiH family protein
MRSSEAVFRRTNGIKWVTFPPLEECPFLLHGFLTETENFSPQGGEAKLQEVLSKINREQKRPVTLIQTHHDTCVVITGEDILKRRYKGDAVLTNRDDIVISVSVADCLPIFLLDQRSKVIGLVHAGWRGTLLGIARRAAESAKRQLKCDPARFVAVFGPCIHSCCYQVSHDVGILFGKECTRAGEDGGLMLDLVCANMKQLASCGVKEDKMFCVDRCTCCDREQFSSYRREGKNTVKMIAFMGLRGR